MRVIDPLEIFEMAISRSDYSDEGWGRVLQDRWDRLQQLVDSGQLERHPLAADWNSHSKLLRDARRAKAQDDDLPNADPSTAAHGGRSVSTLETSGSERENTSTVTATDSVQRLRELGVSSRRIHEILHPHSASAADNEAAAAMIPSLKRL